MGALYRGLIVSAVVALAGFLLIAVLLNNGGYLNGFDSGADPHPVFNLFWCAVIGIVITVLIVAVTEFFTGAQFWPVRTIARASQTGPRHQHHRGPRDRHGGNGDPGAHHRHRHPRRPQRSAVSTASASPPPRY